MPKPIEGVDGSSLHTHMSLFEGERNAFFDPTDRYYLSKTARSFVAGLLRHAREITAVTNQWVNSYKRLVPGFEAPLYVCWGVQEPLGPGPRPAARSPARRLGADRVSRARPRVQPVPRVRADPGTAGLRGIEHEYDLPPEAAERHLLA